MAAGCGLLIATALTAQRRDFERILWVNASVPANAAFYAAVKKLGFTAVTVSGDQDPAAPGAHGLRFYRDQVAGKGILELRAKAWEELQKAYDDQRDPAVLVRPACLAEPNTIETLRAITEKRLEAAVPHGPFAISLGDEISVTRHANPLDFCFSAACLRDFRRFLMARYENVEQLNRAWGSSFVEMSEVKPFTADRIRARELGGVEIPRNLRPWSEHLEFRDRQFAGVVGGVASMVSERAPGVPHGLTGMQPPSAYGGHDYRRLMPRSTFYEAYDIGGARDLAMCFAPRGAMAVATLFAPGDSAPIEFVRARCFDMLAHGMAGTVVWSAQQVFDSELRPTEYGRELGAAAKWLDGAGNVAARAELLRAPVWIVESQPSVRAHWMLDSAVDGRTWIRRLSSYERTHSTSQAARYSWLRLFEDLGLQPRFVSATDLAVGLKAGPPRLLVLPAMLAISNAEAAAIASFVADGGVALADHSLGLYDEHLQRRDDGVLDALFGVRGRSLAWRDILVRQGVADDRGRPNGGAAVAEVGVHGELAEPVGDFHVHVERKHGRGKAVYLNLAVCESGRARLDPERLNTALELRRRVRGVAWDAGIRPPVEIVGEGLPTCIERMLLRTTDGRRLLAIRVNALESPALMRQLGQRGPRQVRMTFPSSVELTDLISGQKHGPGTEFEVSLGPWVGLLYEVRDAE